MSNNLRGLFLAAGLLAVVATAAWLRLPHLAARPMHADEANQAKKAGDLYETGIYRYDPGDHHGPSLYWLTLPVMWLSGVEDFAHSDESVYRLLPAVFGVALVLLVLLMADGLGAPAVLVAALLTALSPALVFYSRYYIQEMLLVTFAMAAIACLWRYSRSGRAGWAIAAGAAFGLMHATKETWVLSAAAMASALALTLAWGRLRDGADTSPTRKRGTCSISLSRLRVGLVKLLRARIFQHGLAALAAACLVAAAFYSGFGQDLHGPWDSIRAYVNYWDRGREGGLQAEPWPYYFQLLLAWQPARRLWAPDAAIVLLAAAGLIGSLGMGGVKLTRGAGHHAEHGRAAKPLSLPLVRFLAFYAVILTALYSAIPYKTPWCAVGFLHAMVLVAAAGAAMLIHAARTRSMPATMIVAALLLAAIAHLGWQSYLVNFRIPVDRRHPYGHSATSPDMLKLAGRLEALARVSPEGHDMIIHVVVPDDYWPLPWYLRRFNPDRVGYWRDAAAWRRETAGSPPPSVVLLSPEVSKEVDAGLGGKYNKQMIFGLRPEVFLLAYVRDDLWQALLAAGR
ncbi:MAG: flippase activity-associated protein Agl23 [Thermoguttaceae bacterium]